MLLFEFYGIHTIYYILRNHQNAKKNHDFSHFVQKIITSQIPVEIVQDFKH